MIKIKESEELWLLDYKFRGQGDGFLVHIYYLIILIHGDLKP